MSGDDAGVTQRVEELPMVAFSDRVPVREEIMGEQTILIHTAAATWQIEFFEAGWEFPDRWFYGEGAHWLDITGMWPGVTAQVTEFRQQAIAQHEGGRGEPVARNVIERAIADDLIDAIYKAEGWTKRDKAGFATRTARCNSLYEITVDPRRNRYVATPKAPQTVEEWQDLNGLSRDELPNGPATPVSGLPKKVLEKWAQGWSRTPATVLKAFIDAGLCNDQSPSREELRLFHPTQQAEEVARLREALAAIDTEMQFPNPLEAGFVHGKPTFVDMQRRVEIAQSICRAALNEQPGGEEA